jgi:hypothetical protein
MKTFEPEILEDAEDVANIFTNIFDYYKNDPVFIKKRIREMVDLVRRKKYEDTCEVPHCFHAKMDENF